MALKFKLNKKDYDNLDESVQDYYVMGEDDEYVLDVEGAADKKKLDEFRTNNRNQSTELTKLKKKFKDIDPEKYAMLLAMEQEKEEGKLIESGDIETVIENRIKKAMKPVQEENEKLQSQVSTGQEHLNKLLIDQKVVKIAAKMGAHTTAIDDICNRARSSFTIVDGKALAVDEDGDPVLDASGSHLSMDDWMGNLKTKGAPHCFRGSKGGNEDGNDGGTKPTGDSTSHDKIKTGIAKASG